MKILNLKFLIFNFQFICLMLLIVAGAVHAASWQWIDGAQVQTRMKEGSGLWLIDVRGAAAYDIIHIEGSVNIPSEALAHKKFPVQKTLILVDDSLGQKAAREAAEALVKKGHERVFVLDGGIVVWKIEGRPIVESRAVVRGVNAGDLKWALTHSIPVKIYDLRDEKERKLGSVQNAEAVSGSSVSERVQKVRDILSKDNNKKELTSRLKKPETVVLVFSASVDAEVYAQKILQTSRADVRYLNGGYEAMISDRTRETRTSGVCPTCPGNKKQ